ncbi:MAG: beta-ketoacyl-[acyl-carrier-protein] synthase family protein [Candidatus Brocadiia bacterium]
MSVKKAVITGAGVLTPFGYGVDTLMKGLSEERCATCYMDEWESYSGLNSRVAAPVSIEGERQISRRYRRTMSPMSIYAAQAADMALDQAGLGEGTVANNPDVGCIVGHTTGSPKTLHAAYRELVENGDFGMFGSSDFFKCISHSASLNLAQYLGITGTVMATSAACASGLQAVGTALAMVRDGRQKVVVCGGAEELHVTVTGSFDILFATSDGFNDCPSKTPRPFDRDRDGLVCGEGAGIVVVEEKEHALNRGADVLAEISGYNTCGNGAHVSRSNPGSMEQCMRAALDDGGIKADEVDYINAHATGTAQGDAAEAEAIGRVFPDHPAPVSSLKGNIGHTLGASGPIELVASLQMMRTGILYPTHNLGDVAEDCQGVNLLRESVQKEISCILKNSFAFGGINAAMVCRRGRENDE